MLSNPSKRGFTLIELLVTISIIAILATVGVSIYMNAQESARDGRRRQDVEAMHSVIEQVKLRTGSYPATAGYSCAGITGVANCNGTANAGWTALVGGSTYYLDGNAPVDPYNKYQNSRNFTYYYDGAGRVCAFNMETMDAGATPQYCINPQQ